MKGFITLIIIVGNLISCGGMAKSLGGGEALQGNSNSASQDIDCRVSNYRRKSETELSAMSPRELIEELIKNNPNSFDSYSSLTDYEDLIEGLVRKEGVKALPVIS